MKQICNSILPFYGFDYTSTVVGAEIIEGLSFEITISSVYVGSIWNESAANAITNGKDALDRVNTAYKLLGGNSHVTMLTPKDIYNSYKANGRFMNTTSGECVVDSRDPGTLGIISIANNALLGIVDKLYKPTSETVKVMDQGFGITSKLAVALVPLVILLTIAAAMRAGASSVTGIAEARSSAINLLFCIGLAFSSRWLLGKISSVSYSIATEIGKGAILFSDSMLTSLTFGSAILIMLFTFVFMETLINNHFSNTQ